VTITLQTTAPCVLHLREILVTDCDNFAANQQQVVDAVEPLRVNPAQLYDYDNSIDKGDTPDVAFALYGCTFEADAAGKTSHILQVDATVRGIKYEVGRTSIRTTTPPAPVAPNECVYLWLSDSASRFPD
jgi:hypothetical protein